VAALIISSTPLMPNRNRATEQDHRDLRSARSAAISRKLPTQTEIEELDLPNLVISKPLFATASSSKYVRDQPPSSCDGGIITNGNDYGRQKSVDI